MAGRALRRDPDPEEIYIMTERLEDILFSKTATDYNPKLSYVLSMMARSAYSVDQVIGNTEILLNGKVISSSPIISKEGIVQKTSKRYSKILKFLAKNLILILSHNLIFLSIAFVNVLK